MKVRLIDTELRELRPMRDRSDGPHVSHGIHDLAVRMGHYERREGEPNALERARMELGNIMEDAWVARQVEEDPQRYIRPGELELDGVYGTPDLLDMDELAVEEFKLTYKSVAEDPGDVKLWSYRQQMKCYCRMMETGLARLRVVFVNGTWKWDDEEGFKPVPRTWEFEWRRAEIEETWRMVSQRARELYEEEGRGR